MISSDRPRVSFVIPVKDDARRLEGCLKAIAQNQCPSSAVEVIVADNGSTDDSCEVAKAAHAQVLSLPGLRVSELRNRAAAVARGEIFAFVDADHEIVSTWIANAVDAVADAGVGAAGAIYSAPIHGSWVQRLYGALRGRTVGQRDVAWLGSGNLAVRRAAFESVGGFDSSLEACEDVDLCQRLRAARWRVIGDERLQSVHLGDPATLGALFRAERWRGRDSLRVGLRGPLTLRDLPGVFIPIIDTAAVGAVLAGALVWPFLDSRGLALAGIGFVVIVGLSALRAVRIVLRAHSSSPVGVWQALCVALTYDLGRAAALVTRASHHRARSDRSPAGGATRK